jgi:predicted metal-dependent HD superfamily phosphohydrolase
MDLKTLFMAMAGSLPGRDNAGTLWLEIEDHYTEKGRHYHTLEHLRHLYAGLLLNKNAVSDWNAVLFALFYHDIIYSPTAKDNEEKSAELAARRLEELGAGTALIDKCRRLILATKKHEPGEDRDINLFTDADLSVLGASPEVYLRYAQNVRKEYSIYPDLLYKPGRKKVLQHFLDMPRIFKTPEFYGHYEAQARLNLAHELKGL